MQITIYCIAQEEEDDLKMCIGSSPRRCVKEKEVAHALYVVSKAK
jgi:hypothetical protein